MIQGDLKKYGIPFDYVICGNGAIIADRNCNILQRFDLEYHLALELLAICSKQPGVSYGISDGDRFGAAKIENVDMSDEMFEDASDYEAIMKDKQIAMIFIQHQNEALTLQLKDELEETYGSQAAFHYNKGAINVSSSLVSKKTGVSALCESLNCEVHVIGDGYNDVPMIEAFSGFAVTGAPEEVKQKAVKVFDKIKDCVAYLLDK